MNVKMEKNMNRWANKQTHGPMDKCAVQKDTKKKEVQICDQLRETNGNISKQRNNG